MAIASLGVGSGLDIRGLVSSLVAAEGDGKTARLDRREIDYQAQLSILGSVKSALKDFQTSYNAIKLTSSFKSYSASSSDSSAFAATATNKAAEATYSLTINQIAKAHKLKTTEQVDLTTSIGTGTLQFVQGDGTTTDVGISDGSLEGIRDAINNASFGVSASIIFNGTGYVLSMASALGTDKAITSITATTTTTGDLSNFETGIDPLVNLSDIQAAQDATFTVNGVGITSQTNTITDVISDVTITLKKGDGAVSTETLTVARDTSAIETSVQEFVDGYNNLITGLNSATFYNADTEQSGVLIGDPTVRGIVNQLRRMLNNVVGDATTQYNSFASIGILTARDGTLDFDAEKLTAALSSKPEEVQFLLAGGNATASGLNTEVVGITDNIGEGIYGVDITNLPRANYQGASFTGEPSFNISGANLNFSVIIDGVSSGVLSLPALNYGNGNSVATAIQNLINADANLVGAGLSSSISYQQSTSVPSDYYYKFASTTLGTTSTIELDFETLSVLDNFVDTVGGTLGTAQTGKSSGIGTIGGNAATFDGNRMTGSGLYSGFVLDITGGATGLRSVNVTGGNISRLDVLINSMLDSDGMITSKTDGLNASINDINDQRTVLSKRLDALEKRLIKQFSAMDSLVAQLNSTSSFLTSQLDQISNIGKK